MHPASLPGRTPPESRLAPFAESSQSSCSGERGRAVTCGISPLGEPILGDPAAPGPTWRREFIDPAGTETPILLVVAHPDDETVSLGGLLPRLRNCHLLCVTDGAPQRPGDAQRAGCSTRQQYAALRLRELLAAAAVAELPAERIAMLGVPDQEASLQMPAIAAQLAGRIETLRPQIVVTHPYEGGHPDHDAISLAVHLALQRLRGGACPLPTVLEMASYHAGPDGMTTGEFLPGPGASPLVIRLTPEQQSLKRQMMACHRSQQHVLARFGVECEMIRELPLYDYAEPPHAGRLWYEHFDWGMTGPRWRRLAAAALRQFGPAPDSAAGALACG